jgi:predicted GNAT family acetyltransferase
MVLWELFRRKPRPLQKVTTGRFEIERDGEVAYLEYSLSGNILELIHTEVPKKLRHMGLASSLAENASTGRASTTSRQTLFVRRCGNT